jgi:hypothetical protein
MTFELTLNPYWIGFVIAVVVAFVAGVASVIWVFKDIGPRF